MLRALQFSPKALFYFVAGLVVVEPLRWGISRLLDLAADKWGSRMIVSAAEMIQWVQPYSVAVLFAIIAVLLVANYRVVLDAILLKPFIARTESVVESDMGEDESEKDKQIIGTDIQNDSGGIGLDIQSTGRLGEPSIGGESIVYAQPGQSVIGTRVTQSGPGIGMRVSQTGPGTGFRSVVVVGKPASDE